MKENKFDSKFRFVIVAAQRAKQLLKGAPSKIKSKHKSPIRLAEEEVKTGAIKYEILPFTREEGQEEEFILAEPIPLETVEAEMAEDSEGQEDDFESEEEVEEETEEFEEEREDEEEEFEEEDE